MTRFRIDPSRSQVWIDARSNVHPIHSQATGLEGFVEFEADASGAIDPGNGPSGKLSFPVSNLSSGNRLEDRELQKRIDARKFPTIDGVLGEISSDGQAGRYRVSGDITFRGVTLRCEDFMDIEIVDPSTVTLSGQSTFDIRDFGMEPPKVLMLRVEPQVAVRVEIHAKREG